MPIIRLETQIHAPVERCFDLARDLDLHRETMSHTGEKAVGGITSGLIGPGQAVTWEATHFGVRQRLTSRITDFDSPHRFVDEMTEGAFQSLHHLHEFEDTTSGTMMRDTMTYVSPLGPLGKIADALFLERYMRGLLTARNALLKAHAERSG